VEESTIAADQQVMTPSEFRRAYGNLWPDRLGDGWDVIPQDVWERAQI
jgi:hypothetical protein